MGLLSVLWPAARVDARLLDLTGETALEYHLVSVDAGGSHSETSALRETVMVGTGGEIFLQAIGRYRVNFSFTNQDRWSHGTNLSGEENSQVMNFYGSFDFFPRLMPLSLSAQRTTQDMEVSVGSGSSITGQTTTTNYNLAWEVPRIWKLPQLHLNLFYYTLETDSCTAAAPPSCDNTSRLFGGSLTASDQYPYRYIIKNTELNWSVSFSSEHLFGGEGSGLNVGARATADSQWTPAVKSNLRVSYATGLSDRVSTVPGGIPMVTTAGATLYYRPSLKLTSSLAYDYTRDTYNRHVGGGDFLYRPTPQFDITGSARGSYLDLGPSQVISGFGSTVVAYRPMLNLNANFSATLGVTQTQAAAQPLAIPAPLPAVTTRSFYQNYAASVSYFKLYDLVRVSTAAGLNVSDIVATGSNSAALNGNWMAEATNTKTQYVTVTGGYMGNYLQQMGGGSTEQWANTLRVNATSSYFHELLLRGDALTLHAFAGDQWITGIGNDQVIDLGTDLRYGWRSIGIGSGYATHITTQQNADFDAYFFELNWTAPPIARGLYLALHGRYDEQLAKGPAQTSSTMAVADVNGTYQIGLVQFSVQYQLNYFDQSTSTLSHSVNLRLTRRFSI